MPKRTIYSAEYELLLKMLLDIRKRKGFTQQEIADRIKRPKSIVGKYERGELRLDIIQLRDMCKAMGVSFAKFARDFDRRAGG